MWRKQLSVCCSLAAVFPAFSFETPVVLQEIQQREASALAVLTKQIALVSNQVSRAQVSAHEALAANSMAVTITDELKKVMIDFSPVTGLPVTGTCESLNQQKTSVAALEQQRKDVSTLVTSLVNTSLTPKEQFENQVAQHKQMFCSVSESALGLCELNHNGMQSYASNYSMFSSMLTLSPTAELNAYDYAQVITKQHGFDLNVACETTSCESAMDVRLSALAAESIVGNVFASQIAMRRGVDVAFPESTPPTP